MKVREIMSEQVAFVRPDSTIRETASVLRDRDLGGVPVVEEKKIVGFVTDRDLVIRSLANGDDPEKSRTSDVMTTPIASVHEDQEVADAAKMMREARVRRLLVTDSDDKAVGVLALADLAHGGLPKETVAEVVSTISEETPPERPSEV
ncbi:MAG: CBS domain-containing protein [Candidatus Eisenbacteria bacterium]|nr:CBS domain-containing protein [Candidatus Latescibacterota bacterium]MBD3301199.1 CBS domain-containing protein [Candidatus Eisenbacteria bacterium]